MQPYDAQMERVLGWVLRGGVVASCALLVAGLVLTFLPAPAFVGAALLHAGLVVLIATPVTRVAASVVGYFVERDWLFVVLTSIVLMELGAAVVAVLRLT